MRSVNLLLLAAVTDEELFENMKNSYHSEQKN